MQVRKKLPGLVLTVGILNLIFGIPMVLCCSISSVATAVIGFGAKAQAKPVPQANPPAPVNKGPMQELQENIAFMEKECPGYLIESVSLYVCLTLIGLILVIAGILLFRGKPSGRMMTILCCLFWCFITLIHIGYTLVLVGPAQKKWEQQAAGEHFDESEHTVGLAVGVLIAGFFPLLHTALAVGFLMTRKVRDYFTSPNLEVDDQRAAFDETDYRRDDAQDRWGS